MVYNMHLNHMRLVYLKKRNFLMIRKHKRNNILLFDKVNDPFLLTLKSLRL